MEPVLALEPEPSSAGSPERPPEIINLTSASEAVAVYQLAARWAERFAEPDGGLEAQLELFRRAYLYLDAVTRGLEPPGE
jgi:hypothetical protein